MTFDRLVKQLVNSAYLKTSRDTIWINHVQVFCTEVERHIIYDGMHKTTHKDEVALLTDDDLDSSRRRSNVGVSALPASSMSGLADNCEPMCWRHRSYTARYI